MTYILLVAGRGSRLMPLTLKRPKSLYRLDKNTSVIKRMINLIRKNDDKAEIVVVTGFLADHIKQEIQNVTFVHNPFYEKTNSIASLWFAKNYLLRDNVTIINGDIVMEKKLIKDEICKETDKPYVLLDSSINNNGDYNVQVKRDKVLVMSKELDEYYGEYAGITKLDTNSARNLYEEIEIMVNDGAYDQWYENALVQLIFDHDFELYYNDICEYKWTEVDCVSDMLLAKQIHMDDL